MLELMDQVGVGYKRLKYDLKQSKSRVHKKAKPDASFCRTPNNVVSFLKGMLIHEHKEKVFCLDLGAGHG